MVKVHAHQAAVRCKFYPDALCPGSHPAGRLVKTAPGGRVVAFGHAQRLRVLGRLRLVR